MDSTVDQTDLTVFAEARPPLETTMTEISVLQSPRKTKSPSFPVWKSTVNGIDIMRRASDAYFNASHVAKLLSTADKEQLFLELAKQGMHEDVQSGSKEIHGIWVPMERIVTLATQFQIYNDLKPLLKSIERTDFATPVKKRTTNNFYENSLESPTKKYKPDLKATFKQYTHDIKLNNPNYPFTFKPIAESPEDEKSRYIISNLFLPTNKSQNLLDLVDGNQAKLSQLKIDIPIDDNGQTALHLAATLGRTLLVRDLLENGANRLRGDNDGQTALVRALLATNCYELGCFDKLLDLLYPCLLLVDQRGRTVLHHIAITCGLKGRDDASKYYLASLLEWVVTKGSQAPGKLGEELRLENFRKSIVNKSDKYGNTCLNYATFTGDKYLVSQLLDIGADPNKANKIGVKPGDWGVEMLYNNKNNHIKNEVFESDNDSDVLTQADNGNSKDLNLTPTIDNDFKADDKTVGNNKSKSMKILESIQDFIGQLGKKYEEDIETKSKEIEKLNPIFKEKTTQLSQKRKQYDELEKMVRKISGYNSKIENLDKAINNEQAKFEQEVKQLNIKLDQNNSLGNFDADQPFIIDSVYSEIERQINNMISLQASKETTSEELLSIIEAVKPEQISLEKEDINDLIPSDILQARIKAYERNNEELLSRLKEKKKSSLELEQQFKRIIALCIGSDAEKIDDKLLSNLLMSVENEPDPEIGEIKKVLKIVNDLEKVSNP